MIRRLSIACAALLVGAASSPADIVHTPADFFLGYVFWPEWEEQFELDVDANGTIDFTLTASMTSFAGIRPENSNRNLIHPSPPPNIGGGVAALDAGYIIDSNRGNGAPEEWFGLNTAFTPFIIIFNTGSTGEFIDHRGFVGLEFEAEDGTHYGWLDIEGVISNPVIRIRGWAYETEPGKGIVAGAIPEPSSVGLLAVGAGVLWLRRRSRARRIRRFAEGMPAVPNNPPEEPEAW